MVDYVLGLVSLRVTKLGLWHLCVPQASFLQKKSNFANCFFDICNAEMVQCRQKP